MNLRILIYKISSYLQFLFISQISILRPMIHSKLTQLASNYLIRNLLNSHQLNRSFSSQKLDSSKILQKYYKKNDLLQGFCTNEATTKYKQRFVSTKQAHQTFFTKVATNSSAKKDNELYISSIGIGSQQGQPKAQDDVKMTQVLTQALTSGINYIDTDINFRYGKSQKVINATLNYLTKQLDYKREEFFVSTKFGYLPNDVDSDLNPEKLIEILKAQRFISDENIVEQIYGWGEGFIEFCVEKSRLSLGLETIDCMFLNNFSEAQMSLVSEEEFKRRLKITFKKLQEVRAENRIRNYGMCSFVGFRSPPNEEGVHLNLQQICNFVKDSVGKNNGFKYIMLPLNLGMPQGLLKWQKYQQNQKDQTMRVFQVAQKQGLKIVLCSPLFQGRVASLPFSSPKMNYLTSNAAKHLQFIRSIQSSALMTTVFGTTNVQHLKENLEVRTKQRVSKEDWKSILPIPQ